MPSIEIDYTKVIDKISTPESFDKTRFISTPDGLALLEIQGTLNLPTKVGDDHNLISIDDINQLIKFGSIEIENGKLTLFIGTSQRLIGKVEKIDPPFGLLEFPELEEGSDPGIEGAKVEMINIIDKKVVFRNRPLPIM